MKTFSVLYYKHEVVINHNRCDIACLGLLANGGDVKSLGTIIIFKRVDQKGFIGKEYNLPNNNNNNNNKAI